METSQAFTPLELTEAHLRQASAIWIEYRDRSDRAGGYDGALLLKRNQAMERVNYLLEGYLLEMSGVEHGPVAA